MTLLAIEGADHADLHFFQKEVWEEIEAFFAEELVEIAPLQGLTQF